MQGPNDLETLLDAPAADSQAMPDAPVETVAAEPEQTGDKDSAAPPADAKPDAKPEGDWIPAKAHLEERRKRQELEKQLKELTERLQPQKQPEPQQQPKADWWASPDEAAQGMQAQFQQQMFETRVAMSERMIKQQHADYDEVSQLFAERAQADPQLMQKLFAHPFPAEFAYTVGQQIKLLNEIGQDPGAYREKLREELRAELAAEVGQQPKGQPARSQAPPAQAAVPRSLARDVNAMPRQANGRFASLDSPASLDDLLG